MSVSIAVPVDHFDAHSPILPLTYELGASFDAKKPTMIVVEDGQQFYVRAGAAAQLQDKIFGPHVNVVGLIPRGSTPAFAQAFSKNGTGTDWVRAWTVFRSEQWTEDIEQVRRHLLGADGKVALYGRSGGAYLVHQYLTKYGRFVSRAFTQSAVNPIIVRELKLSIDDYWNDLGQEDASLQRSQLSALDHFPDQRETVLLVLQDNIFT
jgi:pimeloyl-ACP methyl ester carboxylesterase